MNHARPHALFSLLLLSTAGVGCNYVSVDGARRLSVECPWEACSDATPEGLIFYGLQMFDDSPEGETRLGPVATAGTFTVSFIAPGADDGMPAYQVVFTGDAEVVEQSSHSFTFRALGDGPITARLVHAETGESLDAVVVEASTVQNVVVAEAKAGRDYLVGGCLEWVGVHVETPVGRGFDLDLLLTVDGDAQAEMWDCYRVDVPTGVDHLDLEVLVAGEVHMRTMPVVEGDCL